MLAKQSDIACESLSKNQVAPSWFVTMIQEFRRYRGNSLKVRISLSYRCGRISNDRLREVRRIRRSDFIGSFPGIRPSQIWDLSSKGRSMNFPKLFDAIFAFSERCGDW